MKAFFVQRFLPTLLLAVTCTAPTWAQSIPQARPVPQEDTVSLAIPEGFVARGPIHRVLVDPTSLSYAHLASANAILFQEDYGSFALVVVDERRVGGLDGLKSMELSIVDELTLVNLNGYLLDGNDPIATRRATASIPADLRAPDAPPADGDSRLKIVQFVGPVKDAWLDALRATGAFVVTYVPNDAYVVKADPIANAALARLSAQPFVLSTWDYAPAFKLRPELRPPFLVDSAAYAVVVQVIADAEGAAFASSLAARAIEVRGEPESVLDYLNVTLVLDGANVAELARDPHVFAIEPVSVKVKLDERQGQIMAGNLDATGTQPGNAAYMTWLASKGFPGQNPFPFAVDVTDDGVDRGSNTDVNTEFKVDGLSTGASRLVYNNNYTSDALADGRAGHGNINASIIFGNNTSTGTAAEDANGYQYGLGIAPWVKVGNSKVFANSGAGQFNQPTTTRLANAYNGGARISSNSWGATSGTTYDTDSQAHDRVVRDALSGTAGNQEMTIVFAAGNSGSAASTVHPPGTAKNIITVGASENFRMTGSDGCGIANTGADNAKDIISFSSRGPTSDSRKKPEIMAPGTHIQGAASRATGYDGTGVCNQFWPAGQTLYAWSSGTSHSTPAISGACALFRQYETNNGRAAPSPAMTKAALIASSTYMTGVGANDTLWSNNQGFGRVNLGLAFDAAARIRVDQSQVLGATGGTYSVSGNIASASSPFRVALAWTDAPGATTGNAFVNNLDLEVTLNGTLYRGNVFSGANSIAAGTADTRNNTECVFFPAGTTGSFTITVRGTNIAGDGVPGNADTTDQDFALLAYNATTAAPTPDFTIGATPASQTITVGGSTTYTVTTAALNGFTGNVTLAASPALSGVTYSFSANPVVAGGSSVLTVTTTAAVAASTQTITITGTSAALSHATSVQLVINPPAGANAVKTFTAAPNAAIPDNSTTGVTNTIAVANSLTVSSIAVETVITHTFKGDLVVTLTGPDGTSAMLHNRTGGSTDNVTTTFSIATAAAQALTVFNGKNTAGNWSLRVQDLAAADTGTFNSWKLTFNGEASASPAVAIPDNNTTGVTSTLNFAQSGLVASVKVKVGITHTFQGDLEVALIAPDGTTVLLHNRTGAGTDNINTEYPDLTAPNQTLSTLVGKSITGAWKLRVRDLAAADTGTFNSWTVSFTAQ
ncbi:MAG: proprotein convertase P-domain-containing protein [Planctomycetes bacterium]|nr:proprotein convertase P-domain-containing protein [Planctomycetota bacterium]